MWPKYLRLFGMLPLSFFCFYSGGVGPVRFGLVLIPEPPGAGPSPVLDAVPGQRPSPELMPSHQAEEQAAT